MTGTARDHTGHRFGLLVVISRAGTGSGGSATWLCRCDCGSRKVVRANRLVQKKVVSCGCAQRKRLEEGLPRGPGGRWISPDA